MERCQADSRRCKIPYSSAAAAALAFSDPMCPWSGSATSSSHAEATRGRRPRPSAPMTRTTPPRIVGAQVRRGALGRRSVAPEARLLRLAQEVGHVRRTGDAQVLDRPCRRLHRRRRHMRGAPLADDEAGRARALGRAAIAPEVLRVLDLVERDDQRVGALQDLGRTRSTDRARRRRRCPGGPRCRPASRCARRARCAPGRPSATAPSPPSSSPTPRSSRRRPARSASCTGLRP